MERTGGARGAAADASKEPCPPAALDRGQQSLPAHAGAVGGSDRGHSRDLAANPRGARDGGDVAARARGARAAGAYVDRATHNGAPRPGPRRGACAQRARVVRAHAAQCRQRVILGGKSHQFRPGGRTAQRPRSASGPPPGQLPRLLRLHPPRPVLQRHSSDRQSGVRARSSCRRIPAISTPIGQTSRIRIRSITARPSAPDARSTASA